ncbi:gamma subclass chorismate mutase AroQ [bacterium]|nr:gamma subclass chorismate mutase AroQ [bacterium]
MKIPIRHEFPRLISTLAALLVACDEAPPASTPAPSVVARPAEIQALPESESNKGSRLTQLRAERLAVVDQVALWKWKNARPIEDPAREAKVLDSVEQLAADRGLDRAEARKFFESLMAEARQRQHALHDGWRKSGPPADASAIEIDQLRQKIDRLTPQLLDAWGHSVRRP